MAAGKEEVEGRGTTVEDKRKTGIVQAEVGRMKQLSSTSGYATQRLRVLDKMLQLLSKVRTQSETDELEILLQTCPFELCDKIKSSEHFTSITVSMGVSSAPMRQWAFHQC